MKNSRLLNWGRREVTRLGEEER
uniref:Uncharacterized protein n=1 Tax=Arundo donax TaxID=35708 RepID=A0A0A8Z034_ARUDO